MAIKKVDKSKKVRSAVSKKYETHWNYRRPFTVYINGAHDVNIHHNEIDDKILSYNPIKIWIGKSPKIPMTIFSGGYGRKYDGNSIVLQLTMKKYLYIGEEIYEFNMSEPIRKFYSPIGNNDVPYPVIVTDNKIYFTIEKVYIMRSDLLPTVDLRSAYAQLYDKNLGIKQYKMTIKRIIKSNF